MNDKCEVTQKASPLVPGFACSVSSDIFPVDMDIMAYYCLSRECPCNNTTMYFYKADSFYKRKLFKIVVDYLTWKLIATEVYSSEFDCPKMIYDFMDCVSSKTKSLIQSGKDEVISENRYAFRDDIDYTRIKIENKVCYLDIFRIAPYEELVFAYNGTQYVVLDHYCVNPKCDCMDVLLAFQVVTGGKALEAPVVVFVFDFESGERYIERKSQGVSSAFAEELYAEFEGLLERKSVEPLIGRCNRMKKWGEEYLSRKLTARGIQNVTNAQKVGRNSPCPCGSGTKFKKCCGAL